VLSGPKRRRRWSTEQKQSNFVEVVAPGASVCEVARRLDVVPGQMRRDLRTAAAGFAEVVVAPGPHEGTAVGPAALEIELVRDIRVHIAATAPKEFASVIIKALAAR